MQKKQKKLIVRNLEAGKKQVVVAYGTGLTADQLTMSAEEIVARYKTFLGIRS